MDNNMDHSIDAGSEAVAEMMSKVYGFLINMLQIYSKALIGIGVVLLVLGLVFLIFGRRVIKVLYFFGGLVVISFISMLIGTIIIYFNKVKPLFTDPSLLERDNPFGGVFKAFIILLIVSLVLGLVIGILAAIYGKFGIVLVGLACGMMIGLAIGVTTGNAIAIGCLTIGLGIILGVLCGFYKRLFEVLFI
ncbi:hypothetical protein K502DRAFT_351789 [Neoconidiobolus thromboides FSU 785]|nr:hypothetical protein K502DRAFT_351789 [Neoconidiobolus thromboides FSU 785]